VAGPTQLVIHAWESRLTDAGSYREQVLPRKLEVDAWYVEHATLRCDLEVLRALAGSILRPDRRHAVHRRLAEELPATMAAIEQGEPAGRVNPGSAGRSVRRTPRG
jgi:hypothetical protein